MDANVYRPNSHHIVQIISTSQTMITYVTYQFTQSTNHFQFVGLSLGHYRPILGLL